MIHLTAMPSVLMDRVQTVHQTLKNILFTILVKESTPCMWPQPPNLLKLGMCRTMLKSESVGFGFCTSNPLDSNSDLSHDHS